jgi:chromosome transmission fidelity protein 4
MSSSTNNAKDPCIYDSTGTLLTLVHWRQPSRASWIPLLDTKLLPRLASGRKHESYYPVAVADNKYHCIILKGGDQYPYFPRPLLSEFDFSIPLTSAPRPKKTKKKKRPNGGAADSDEEMLSDADGLPDEDSDAESDAETAEDGIQSSSESLKLTQTYLLKTLHSTQLRDLLSHTRSTASQRALLARLELDIDKTLLQLLAVECREGGEERGMRALEIVQLMRDRSGKMLEAAGKVAERYGRAVLREKIRELGEKRAGAAFDGEEEDDDDGEDPF